MARASRRISESGFYHVILRGDGKRQLFEDDCDREVFLDLLSTQVVEHGVDVIAWCLMGNHVHLVLLDARGRLSEVMAALAMRYAQHFNRRTGHVGHVFQERFRSMPIEDDAYLLEAVRYVLNNPARAGICPAESYRWSSYREYAGAIPPRLTRVDIILDMVGGSEGMVELCSRAADPAAYRFDDRARIPDDEMSDVAARILGDVDASHLGQLPICERNERLRALRRGRLSVRQIERLTGIGRKTITRVTT